MTGAPDAVHEADDVALAAVEGTLAAGSQRCADLARAADVDPVGTAVCAGRFLLVEWPRPWPRDIADVAELAPVVAEVRRQAEAGEHCRIQLVEGLAPRVDDRISVIHYRRRGPGFAGFGRRAVLCERIEAASAAIGLLRDKVPPTPRPDVRDVLVCTHGSRDVCCGSSGTRLFESLQRAFADDPGLNVWRTSHLGGHRFAPTALSFPEGQYWAHLDGDRAVGIVARTIDVGSVKACYRGSAGFAEPAVQAVEREAFVEHGWAWLDTTSRDACYRAADGPDGAAEVCLTYVKVDGTHGSLRATVVDGGATNLPPCRSGPGGGTTDRRWIISDLRWDQLDPAR